MKFDYLVSRILSENRGQLADIKRQERHAGTGYYSSSDDPDEEYRQGPWYVTIDGRYVKVKDIYGKWHVKEFPHHRDAYRYASAVQKKRRDSKIDLTKELPAE